MSQHGAVFVLDVKQPSAKIVQSIFPLKHDLPLATRFGARVFGVGLCLIVPRIANGASASEIVTHDSSDKFFIHTPLAHRLGHHEIGDVSRSELVTLR